MMLLENEWNLTQHINSIFDTIRSRKVSVFYNKLGHVSEAGEEDTREEVEECSSDLTSTDEEEADYAFPLDAVTEENSEHSIYENPHVSSSQVNSTS